MTLLVLVGLVAGVVVAGGLGAFLALALVHTKGRTDLRMARESVTNALAKAEPSAKEIILAGKEEEHRIRASAEDEARQRQSEVLELERNAQQREEIFLARLDDLEKRQVTLKSAEEHRERIETSLRERELRLQSDLQSVSGMSREQAREHLLASLERSLSQEVATRIREAEKYARQEAEARARDIVVTSIQRVAAEQTTESTVAAVHLPNDEMKGRIIGREGRNIRALELATGVDLIIDDTPETVMISGFDPIRREIARTALEQLLSDGRIHPSRIEEVVAKARDQVQAQIRREGEEALFEIGIQEAHPELLRLCGCLPFSPRRGRNRPRA